MLRTQIYLTQTEARGLARLAATTGRKKSEIIRDAVDEYLQRLGPQDNLRRLREGRGIWSDREDINPREIREEFDRF
jgi:predicted DNA-binding protein